jgi:hypothetical protein
MKVAMMQPSFLPWMGFFELIYQSERFIFLDDFQFSVQSYHQRNRLFCNHGQVDWYTVPVKKVNAFKLPLDQVIIMETIPWRAKMWKRIQQNYSKAEHYHEIAPFIEKWLFSSSQSLAENNINFIMGVCNVLNLDREYHFSSQLSSKSQRSARVLELLRWCEADRYYCAKGSFDYMFEDGLFPVEDIDILFQNFRPQAYPQVGCGESFCPYLSVLDALMNAGPMRTLEMIENGTETWHNWDQMVSKRLPGITNSQVDLTQVRGKNG